MNYLENRLLIRVLLIGDSKSGKTCIMLQYTESMFLSNYVRTIAVDYRSKANLIQSKFAKICIFDTPGDPNLGTLTPAYWHLADIIIFVVSFDDYESLNYAKRFDSLIFEQAEIKATKVVLLNKNDLKEPQNKQMNEFELEVSSWADNVQAKFYSCSAKENKNVTDPIDAVVSELVDKTLKTDKATAKAIMTKSGWRCETF